MSLCTRLLLIATLAASTMTAHADTVTDIISFTATGQVAASGTYTITFDPTLTYTDATVGLIVNSFSDTFTAPTSIGFDYNPLLNGGELVIGGLLNGVGLVSGGNDYYLLITDFATTPTFTSFGAETTTSLNAFTDTSGSLTVTPVTISAIPEPSSFMLLGTGILGFAGVVRRKFRR